MDRHEVLKNVALCQGMSDRELAAPLPEQALVQFGTIGMTGWERRARRLRGAKQP